MLIVHVAVRVKPDVVDAFREASLHNARASAQEPGIARFEVLQDLDDPTHFTFIEEFRTREAQAAHRETAHYQTWRAAVADMMATPRTAVTYRRVS